MPTTIETPRLVLRPFDDTDIDDLFRIQGNPDAMRYTFCPTSRSEAEQRLRAYAALEKELGFVPWTVVLRAEARIIGWGGLTIDPFDPGWGVEIVYFFDPTYWGQGYATELVQASLEHGFAGHGLPEIGAFAHPHNAASIHILEKCGFRYGSYEPLLTRNRYAIRHEEWCRLTA